MKLNVQIPQFIADALNAAGYDTVQLGNALNAAYNSGDKKDGLKIVASEEGIKSARGKEGKDGMPGAFKSKDGFTFTREGQLNTPLRMVAWIVNFTKFVKAHGLPVKFEVSTLPDHLVVWLEAKFKATKATKATATATKATKATKATHRNGNGNVTEVETPAAPVA